MAKSSKTEKIEKKAPVKKTATSKASAKGASRSSEAASKTKEVKPKKTTTTKAKAEPKEKKTKAAASKTKKTTTKTTAAKKETTKKAPAKKAATKSAAKAKETKVEAAKPKKAPAKAKTTTKAVKSVAKKTKAPANSKKSVTAPKAPVASSSPSDSVREKMRAIETDSRDLPRDYDDTKIVLMSRDPERLFVYWEISRGDRKRLGIEKGKHHRPLILRIHEKVRGYGNESNRYDVEVSDYVSQWYLHIKTGLMSVSIELGIYNQKTEFVSIAQSNEITIPQMGISEQTDVEFAEINDEIYGQIVELSGGSQISKRLGSDEFLRSLQQRVINTIYEGPFSSFGLSSGEFYGLSSGLFGGASSYLLPSSFSLSSSLVSGEGGEDSLKYPRGEERDFWLEVGVDVIVYGATQPDAHVTFMGQKINLTPDGTFRIRMVLPNTSIEFPVIAESNDGQEKRKVTPIVTRITKGNPHEPA